MALYHFSVKVLSRGSRNTVRSLAYRAGCELYDSRTDQTFNYQDKPVQHVELILPKEAPSWAVEIQKLMADDRQKGVQAFCDCVEAAEKRIDARVWREFEFSLHRDLTKEQNILLAREFVEEQLCSHGMTAQLNFHFDVDKDTGEEKPHCHVLAVTRRLEENGWRLKKDRDWNKKELVLELRQQWQEYSNTHLKRHGHDIQIDHRSHKERGIEMEPQPKRGRGILEQEKRTQEVSPPFVTEKSKAFHEVQLRNLYRLMRQPEIVFDIVTKHHATFMWADVQKIVHQYVDDAPLFQRLEEKLKNSKDLLVLQSGEIGTENAIYTTRRMLTAERSLVETADALGGRMSHGVAGHHRERGINKANADLNAQGGLSEDQVKAIHHLVDEGQLKCVVGIAGAGKTTALGVCQEIWQMEGYAVYGLTPTGKAAQNLEQSGIRSSTLHKFLKSYEEGRCQYNENSVLVLDEAGMVDMERFEKLLGAAKDLGVKLIIVGDGAQLQPVEAGPAFRLVTARLGKAELTTVLRQKEDWQKEATALFGQQKTEEAITKYADKGHVHIIRECLPFGNTPEEVVKLYEVSHRLFSLIYREMAKDVKQENPEASNTFAPILAHQDFERYAHWKDIERKAARSIFQNVRVCQPILEERQLDPLSLALVLSDKHQPQDVQKEEAKDLLQKHNLDYLRGIQKASRAGVDVREAAKEQLVQAWHRDFNKDPDKTTLMLAYSNRDVNDLNQSARALLKESGYLSKEEFSYTIKKETEDDFGRKQALTENKSFSKGDRLVFTRNNYGLGVKNGTMGTITVLDAQKIHVRLDEGALVEKTHSEGQDVSFKEVSFSPKLNPHFDQGWAVTIHKSQGTTVDKAYVLASYEMIQNLAYVAMTRHRDDMQVFGSSFDFWRPEKLPQVLAKSGEKLAAGDYLSTDSLNALMEKEDHLLTKIFERVSNELEAIGAVSKQAFWTIADHFLKTPREKEAPVLHQEGIREEVRANELLQQKSLSNTQEKSPLEAVYEEMSHPAFANAQFIKKVFDKGLKLHGETEAIAYWDSRKDSFFQAYHQNLETVEKELQSPLLDHLEDEWKDKVREFATQDPLKILTFLAEKKEEEFHRRESVASEERKARERVEAQEKAAFVEQKRQSDLRDAYWRFKELDRAMKATLHPPVSLREEFRQLGHTLSQDKDFMHTLSRQDTNITRVLERFQEQRRERELERDDGGYSR